MEIIGEQKLLDEIAIHYDRKTIVIESDAGLGKTVLIEKLKERGDVKIDELVVWRTQSIEDIDSTGMPYITEDKTLTYAKMGLLDNVMKNSDRQYMIFVDEVNRARRDIEPFLFQLFESKIDGVYYPNLHVIAAINMGDGYNSNIDFNDKALRRRIVLFHYKPKRDDFINGIKERNYHPVIQEVAELMDIHYSHEIKDEEEICTSYGSWGDWDHRLRKLTERKGTNLTLEEIIHDFTIHYSLYFNELIGNEIINRLNDIKLMIKIDMQKEIIDVGSIPEKYVKLEEELKIRAKNFIVKNAIEDNEYLGTNSEGIIKLYSDRKEFIMIILTEVYETMKAKKIDMKDIQVSLRAFITAAAAADKSILKSINTLFMSRG